MLCNASVALAYLSAYAADAGQMQTLFDGFNYMGNTPVSIGIKFGVLTNGNETIKKDAMVKSLQDSLVQWMNDKSGFDKP